MVKTRPSFGVPDFLHRLSFMCDFIFRTCSVLLFVSAKIFGAILYGLEGWEMGRSFVFLFFLLYLGIYSIGKNVIWLYMHDVKRSAYCATNCVFTGNPAFGGRGEGITRVKFKARAGEEI